MAFSLNKLGDMFLNIGKSTLQTGTFYATAKAMNSPCSIGGSVFGCGTFGRGWAAYPMGGCGMGSFGYSTMGMGMGYGMNMFNGYNTQMAIGQAYGQGYALGEYLKAQGGNGLMMMNPYQMLQQQVSTTQTLEPTKNKAAEKFAEHPTELGEQFDANTKSGKTTQFVMSDWNDMAAGKEKDTKYAEYTSNFAKSYIAHMDKTSGNKDNEITLEEFTTHTLNADLGKNATEAKKTEYKNFATTSFKKIDQNGDGKVDWKEMAAVFSTYDSINDGKYDGHITAEEAANSADLLINSNSTQIDKKLRAEYTRLFGNNENDGTK